MKTSKTFNKWKTIIENKIEWFNAPFTENEIIYLRKAIGSSGLKCRDERYQLLENFKENMPAEGFNITVDHQNKGLEYLKSKSYKLNGTLRKNNIFGARELRILNNFKEFKLVDIINASENSYEFYLPIYRCIAEDGSYFDYIGTCYERIKILSIYSELLKIV